MASLTKFLSRMVRKKKDVAIKHLYRKAVTSLSDEFGGKYPLICEFASKHDEIFENFKDHADYTPILEHVTYEQGKLYLDVIQRQYKQFLDNENLDKFITSEYIGGGKKYYFDSIKRFFSPTTLRYIKTTAQIDDIFGLKNINTIAEIGVGYGGQFKIIHDIYPFITWTGIDLPQVCSLSKKWLNKVGVSKIKLIDGTSKYDDLSADLFISNYAFSELLRKYQDIYFEKIVKHCPRGYMVWNPLSEMELDGYSAQEFCKKIKGAYIIKEEPLTYKGNCIIIWGD